MEIERSLLAPWEKAEVIAFEQKPISLASLMHGLVHVTRKHFGIMWPRQIALFNGGAAEREGRAFGVYWFAVTRYHMLSVSTWLCPFDKEFLLSSPKESY